MPKSAPVDIDPTRLPVHVGIIMDGNGRWARSRNLNRSAGHKEGLKATKAVVKAASDIGIRYLSLYTFSTENWKRAGEEVSFLMGLVRQHLRREYEFYKQNGIRLRYSGELSGLHSDIQNDMLLAIDETKAFNRLTLNIALNYGGRNEILRAVKKMISSRGAFPEDYAEITEASIASFLDNPDIPDPDLIIRTAGEMRLSNFLLWESAYSELYFSNKLWPDFTGNDLAEAIVNFQSRVRKYGGTA
jgi:undecaprenyl diphosphate synthase